MLIQIVCPLEGFVMNPSFFYMRQGIVNTCYCWHKDHHRNTPDDTGYTDKTAMACKYKRFYKL